MSRTARPPNSANTDNAARAGAAAQRVRPALTPAAAYRRRWIALAVLAGATHTVALTAGFRLAFLAAATLAALGAVTALTLMRDSGLPRTPGGDIPQVLDTSTEAAG